ncbi:sensor histidine kinase [Halalkalibacter akibai]|uniref:Two-component sensor histidine kinase n=1 Tax=Halalkalibacter akibai (strain ATCC 43226 / DSM 21942 / CIP 109018 / JCM 9157 / 1139) TaxID=1236973 RepID=W4QPH5_HALA3|nr:sensor histidine kinase [Halalkalibacter akibai]GAE33563.1 two-component sensor histidine kinase [Halalkalibacter akibai JCM 9157]
MHDVQLLLDQISNEFVNVVDQAVGISSSFYTDTRIYDFFDTEYDSAIDYVEAYDFYLLEYNRYSPLYYSIQSVSFYTDNPSIIFAGGVRPINEFTMEHDWYARLTEVKHPILIRTNPNLNSELFSIIRELDYYKNRSEYQKIVRIDLNPLTLRHIFNNIAFQGDVYLLNGNGSIEYTSNNSIDWRSNNLTFEQLEIPDGTIIVENQVLPQSYSEGMQIVGTVKEDVLLEELYNSRQFIVILATITFILPTLLIILISKSIHARLLRVLRYIKKMKKQNFELIEFAGDKDEIGELTNEFNNMSRTINKLINEVYIANIEKKDLEIREKQAQLSALQSQINPHFLFNALETIRMRSVIKGEKETAKIIQNMAKIFRNSLTWGKDFQTVREELILITCFLEIQKYRFGDKIDFEFQIDDEAYDCIIPNMVFLPFVENASIHGVESIKENGKIHISIKNRNKNLYFTITDNGLGMEKEQLTKLMQSLENGESMGDSVGIKNVYYRLKLYYKNDFDFSITSNSDTGTKVEIRLPADR